jgi:hypothetical protein
MSADILKIAASIAERRMGRYGRRAGRKLGVVVAAGYVALSAAFATCGFLLWALWAYARPFAGPVGTPLLLACVCALITLILALVIASTLRRPQRERREPAYSEAALALEAQNLVRKQKMPILLTAALLGLLAGSQKR